MSAPTCPDCGADARSFESHALHCRTRTPPVALTENLHPWSWLEEAYDERCRELTALQELHDSVVGTAHQLRDERDALLAAAKLTALHFQRNLNSGTEQGDDEHEAWTALLHAIAKAQQP